jgi:hypothetical protein
MDEKKQKTLLICLEVISMLLIIPSLFWGTIRLLLGPIENSFYPHDLYEHRVIYTWMVFVFIIVLDFLWIILIKLCPKDKAHVKIILTFLIFTLSIAILTCFIIIDILSGAFA